MTTLLKNIIIIVFFTFSISSVIILFILIIVISSAFRDSQLIFKQEVSLVSIYHNTVHNYLVMMPDVNNLELNSYIVETSAGVPWGYQYSIEIEFEDDDAEELVTLVYSI